MRNLALFDFDGTITTKDSMVEFIKYAVGERAYYFGLFWLSPMLIAYALKIIPNHKAKEHLLAYFFKEMDINIFESNAKRYSLQEIDKIVRKKAIEKITWHKKEGDRVIIISASLRCWLEPWCIENGIELLSTEFKVKDGKFTTKNCYGIEKVNRLKKICDIDKYEYIYAYGDSHGDRELLALGNQSFYKPFT